VSGPGQAVALKERDRCLGQDRQLPGREGQVYRPVQAAAWEGRDR